MHNFPILQYFNSFGLFVTIYFLFGCNSDENTESLPHNNEEVVRIMPLGASRVQGNHPFYESYRYELWKDLKDGGYNFDFIGTETDFAQYAPYNNETFDPDHSGFAGWTSSLLLNHITDWLEEIDTPDIVLFSSPGGNDGFVAIPYETTLSNINAIIDILQQHNPKVTIIIEQLAPPHSTMMNTETMALVEMMHSDMAEIAENRDTNESDVIAVDMFTGFGDEYLADALHYNEEGAIFIADRYYSVLNSILE